MADIPEYDLAESRPVFATTFENAAAILPLMGNRPVALRFSPQLNARWQQACRHLTEQWANSIGNEPDGFRKEVLALMTLAIETGDADCLQLTESLASVADYLELHTLSSRLRAAVSATCETMEDENGLENPRLAERFRHCSQRLQQAMLASPKPGDRSDILDRLFVEDSEEKLDRMRDALDALPIDIYALELESSELIQHAEQIEMWGIYHLARQLQNFVLQLSDVSEMTQDQAAKDISQQLRLIEQALLAVDG